MWQQAKAHAVERRDVSYSDDHGGYKGMPFEHDAVRHSAGEYVREGSIHTQGIESFWAALKRGYHGTYHHMSKKHLPRYIAEFSGRQNNRELDTADQLSQTARQMAGKRLRYRHLVS